MQLRFKLQRLKYKCSCDLTYNFAKNFPKKYRACILKKFNFKFYTRTNNSTITF